MSVTAILAITAMMLILGIFFVSFVNVDLFANVIKQDYNVIEVYLKDDTTEALRDQVQSELKNRPGVESVEYRSKDDAMKILRKRWGDSAYLLDNLDHNPLPDSVLVFVEDKSAADKIAKATPTLDGVQDVKYYRDTVEKLAKITNFIQVSSIIVMVFLIVISIIIVSNTIKLTVFNRSKEIAIMKYLGATDWFVRAPFLVEGIFIGFISAAVATGLMYVIYDRVIKIIGPDIMKILSVPVVPTNYLIYNLMIIFAALGVGIGTCGSIISIRRFLDK